MLLAGAYSEMGLGGGGGRKSVGAKMADGGGGYGWNNFRT